MSENDPNKSEAEASTDAETPKTAATEVVAANAVEPNVEGDEGDEGDEGEGDDSEGEGQGAEAGGEGQPAKKKRRRRRKKKKGAGEAAAEGGQPAPAKPASHAPFGRWFEGQQGKKHPFTAGEIVAGVVQRVEDGAAVIDLFGKALAIVDVLEPREIAPLPEAAPAEAAAEAGAPAGEAQEEAHAAEAEHAEAHEEAHAAVLAEAHAEEGAVAPEGEAHEEPEHEETEEHEEAATPSIEAPAAEPPQVGEVFRGRIGSVSESGHAAIINRRIDRPKAKQSLKEAQEARRRVQGVVFGFNRGGFDVIVAGVRAFCPASGMSLEGIDDPTAFVGRKFEFTIPPSKGGKSIVVSRRTILEREQRKHARERMKALKIGERMKGRILDVRDYGLLVDLGGGLDGLVHLSEVSWSRGVRPQDAGKRGDEVEVQVLRVQPSTRKDRHGRVSLSIRACQQDPWETHAEILREGHAQKGKVVRTAEFGAFVELAPGVEGMLHISELGGKNLTHANQVLKDGEEIAVLVERVDRGQRRISLSRLSGADAEALESGSLELSVGRAPKPGQLVTVVVEKVEHHGLLVHVEGVAGRRGRGYIPNRELGDQGGGDRQGGDRSRKQAPIGPGSKLEVKVVGTDRDGGLRCSVKAKLVDEERNAVREYKKEVSQKGFGTFGDLLRAKLGK